MTEIREMSPLQEEFIQLRRSGMTERQAHRYLNSGPMRMYQSVNKKQQTKAWYTWKELMTGPKLERHALIDPYLLTVGLSTVAGPPDSGKSTFCRQLAAHVALGRTSFCGMKLNPRHNRALYVSTEEAVEDVYDLLTKQWKGLESTQQGIVSPSPAQRERGRGGEGDSDPRDRLGLIFNDTLSNEELLDMLDAKLSRKPHDLVVIDSFADVFMGRDINSNMDVRKSLEPFYQLTTFFKCAVVFVAHINKSAYALMPDQTQVQGAGALIQKVRLAFDLRRGRSAGNYLLTVTKANHLPPEEKRTAMKLEFDESTLLFRDTHEVIADIKSETSVKVAIDWLDLFQGSRTMTSNELLQKINDRYKLKERQARQRMSEELRRVETGVWEMM